MNVRSADQHAVSQPNREALTQRLLTLSHSMDMLLLQRHVEGMLCTGGVARERPAERVEKRLDRRRLRSMLPAWVWPLGGACSCPTHAAADLPAGCRGATGCERRDGGPPVCGWGGASRGQGGGSRGNSTSLYQRAWCAVSIGLRAGFYPIWRRLRRFPSRTAAATSQW